MASITSSLHILQQKRLWIYVTCVLLIIQCSALPNTCRPSPEADELKRVFERFRVSTNFDPFSPNPMEAFEEAQENCPHLNPRTHGVSLQSLCPWEYYQHHSENRYPNKLWYARCMCHRCLGTNYRCRPVYHNVAVIREQCLNGTYDFYWDTETIPVGCTCIHEPIRRLSKRSVWHQLPQHVASQP